MPHFDGSAHTLIERWSTEFPEVQTLPYGSILVLQSWIAQALDYSFQRGRERPSQLDADTIKEAYQKGYDKGREDKLSALASQAVSGSDGAFVPEATDDIRSVTMVEDTPYQICAICGRQMTERNHMYLYHRKEWRAQKQAQKAAANHNGRIAE